MQMDDVLRRVRDLENGRANFNNLWEKTARVVLPENSRTFFGAIDQTQGQRKDYEQFDSTAYRALTRGAAALESLICPDGIRWHGVTHSDMPVDVFTNSREVMDYYDKVSSVLFALRGRAFSGFSAAKSEVMQLIMGFGNGVLYAEELRDPHGKAKGIRYRCIPLGECYWAANDQGIVDTFVRKYRCSVTSMAERFGYEKLPDNLKEQLRNKPDAKVTIIHYVAPNRHWDPASLQAEKRPFTSMYILDDREKMVLQHSGYFSQPYSVFRHGTAPGEDYGRGPGQHVLSNVKVLNEEKKIVLKQGMRAIDPVLLANDDGVLDKASLRSGAVIGGAVTDDGRPLIHTLPTGNHAIAKDLMDDERLAINDAFYVTLFQILTDNPQMTATEVMERAREKAALLAPPSTRIQQEGFAPLIHREFDLAWRMGLMPDPPQELVEAGAEYHIEFDAPINRMMRSEAASGITRAVDWAANLSVNTQDPSKLDWFNFDSIVPDVAVTLGARPAHIRTADDVASIRQGRSQEQATQQMIQAAPGMAAMLKANNMGAK